MTTGKTKFLLLFFPSPPVVYAFPDSYIERVKHSQMECHSFKQSRMHFKYSKIKLFQSGFKNQLKLIF